jgi:hypothetical protein
MEVGKEKGYKYPYDSLVTLHPRSQQPFCYKDTYYSLLQQPSIQWSNCRLEKPQLTTEPQKVGLPPSHTHTHTHTHTNTHTRTHTHTHTHTHTRTHTHTHTHTHLGLGVVRHRLVARHCSEERHEVTEGVHGPISEARLFSAFVSRAA